MQRVIQGWQNCWKIMVHKDEAHKLTKNHAKNQFCPIFNFVQFSILSNFQFFPIFNFVQFSSLSNFQFCPILLNFQFCPSFLLCPLFNFVHFSIFFFYTTPCNLVASVCHPGMRARARVGHATHSLPVNNSSCLMIATPSGLA